MKYLILFFLFSMPAMAMKVQIKHYKLNQSEAEGDWRYYVKEELNTGLKTNKMKIDHCYNMNVVTGERMDIPCQELDKIKSTLDLREVDVTDRSASAI